MADYKIRNSDRKQISLKKTPGEKIVRRFLERDDTPGIDKPGNSSGNPARMPQGQNAKREVSLEKLAEQGGYRLR